MHLAFAPTLPPQTKAVRRALQEVDSAAAARDFLFLEAWTMNGSVLLGATLRAQQIRRANPELTARIREELESRS